VLRFVFTIPDMGDAEYKQVCQILNKFVFDVIDAFAVHGKLSSEGKQKSLKLRDAAVSYILKQKEEDRKKELADKKIADKKRQMAAIVNLPPEQQRKAEEKLKKKELKKQMQKKTKRA
jgi:hypothetical protein